MERETIEARKKTRFLLFEQRGLYFYFVLGLTNYEPGPHPQPAESTSSG